MSYSPVPRFVIFVILSSLFLFACGPETRQPQGSATYHEPDLVTGAYLPAWQTAYEIAHSSPFAGQQAAISPPPPSSVQTRPEWSPLDGTLLRWPLDWPQLKPTYLDMLVPLQAEGLVTIVVNNESGRQEALADIEGCAACSLENLEWMIAPTGGVWMRDFGPEFMYFDDLQLGLVDFDYYGSSRPLDNAFPGAYSDHTGIPAFVPGLSFEGGNFQVDGAGNCFASVHVAEENGETEARTVLEQYLGCESVHFIDYIEQEGTHHIDMWMKFVSETTVLVGDYSFEGNETLSYPDNVNEEILDNVASYLADLGYVVVRIPQPSSYWNFSQFSYTIRTHTNSTFINGKILVPVYGEASDQVALDIYAQVLPTITAVGIDSSYIIEFGGAMHCITMEQFPRNAVSGECSQATDCSLPQVDQHLCTDDYCQIATCLSGYQDCNGDPSDGCEVALGSDIHCSACFDSCDGLANATGTCQQGTCMVSVCDSAYANCDGSAENGCEVALGSNSHCSACFDSCDGFANAAGTCELGSCSMGACNSGYADCDSNAVNGCEAPLNSQANCGACAMACTAAQICTLVGSAYQCEDACAVPDADGDGHASLLCGGDDCHDGQANIYPGAVEICDQLDNDCDNLTDEDGVCDVPPDSNPDSGSGCQTAGPARSPFALLLLLMGLWISRFRHT